MSTIFWSLIHYGLPITLTVSVLIGVFYFYGRIITSLVNLPRTIPATIAISTGMATITFAAWYSCKLGIQVGSFITVICCLAAILATLKAIRYSSYFNVKKSTNYRLQHIGNDKIVCIIIVLFSAQAVAAFKFSGQPIGRVVNNDIFSWALVADHFLGNANIANIYPAGSAFFQTMQTDGWGAYFNLAFTSKLGGLPALEATPSFVVMCLTLITFALYEITKKSFKLSCVTSLIVATLTGAGAFLFYIAYNGFYGQLLGTFFFLTLLLSILEASVPNSKFTTNLTILVLPFVGLLLVYQSGFLVFTIFSVIFCALHSGYRSLFKQDFSTPGLTKAYVPLFQLHLALLISLALLPELSLHTILRTLTVYGVAAGWPLPLISPAYLLSLPIWIPFPEFVEASTHYGIDTLMAGAVIIYSLVLLKNKGHELPPAAFAFITLLCIAISTYALAYCIKGGSYQVWKLASFIVIPTSFAINALVAKSVILVLSPENKITNTLFLFIFVLISIGNLIYMPLASTMDSFASKVDSLKMARSVALAEGVNTIVLDTAPLGDTMAAFNYLSKDFKLYPLSASYIPSTERPEFTPGEKKLTRLLIPANCVHAQSDTSNINLFKLTTYEDFVFKKVYFNTASTKCSLYSGVSLVQGFSGSEPWGTWTISSKASVEVFIPRNLQGKNIFAEFEINPFGEQKVVIKGNGVIVGNYVLKNKTTLAVQVPADIVKANKVTFDFTISNPRLASESNPDNHDPRLLGLGFISLMLSDASDR